MINLKFKYQGAMIVFFTTWRGAELEVLRAKATLDLADFKRLRKLAEIEALDLLTALRTA
jgi:hypothetical protein